MMNQHLTDQEITALTRGGVPAADLIVADDHLAQCEHCRRRAEIALPAAAPTTLLTAFVEGTRPAKAHPEFETLAAFLAAELSQEARAEVQAHLSECTQCRDEVRAMDALRREIRDSPSRVYAPARQAGLASGWADLLRAPAWRSALAMGAAAILGVALFFSLRPLQTSREPITTYPNQDGGSASYHMGHEDTGFGVHSGGGTEQPRPVSPVSSQITSVRPTLHWSALQSADHYQVTVQAKNGTHASFSSAHLSVTQWTVPQTLSSGKTYLWSVQAYQGTQKLGTVSQTAAFRVRSSQ